MKKREAESTDWTKKNKKKKRQSSKGHSSKEGSLWYVHGLLPWKKTSSCILISLWKCHRSRFPRSSWKSTSAKFSHNHTVNVGPYKTRVILKLSGLLCLPFIQTSKSTLWCVHRLLDRDGASATTEKRLQPIGGAIIDHFRWQADFFLFQKLFPWILCGQDEGRGHWGHATLDGCCDSTAVQL